jgi:tRNA pseudouridine55 synthase
MNGLILIDKPGGCTSHDVVLRVRRLLGEPRVGHFGTLDPMATGLLVTALGKAPRFFPFYAPGLKSYHARIRLGIATDTYDAEGTPVGPEARDLPDEAALREAMARFEGEISQVPPPFSAKKFRGTPYYRLARAGAETPRPQVLVRVERFALVRYASPEAEVEAVCSSGTYVRSLAHDLGRLLGCGAHLSGLRRTASGEFSIDKAVTLEELAELQAEGRVDSVLIPLEALLPDWPAVVLDESESRRVRTGQALPAERAGAPWTAADGPLSVRLFGPDGSLLGLARLDKESDLVRPFLIIP